MISGIEFLEPTFAQSCLDMTVLITVVLSECPALFYPCPLTFEAKNSRLLLSEARGPF